jgi:hypothetical protein
LTGGVEPDERYLVAQSRGAGGTTELTAPGATGNIAMSASSGTIALVDGTEPLSCLTGADCAAEERIVDLVGYGSAVVREVAPASGVSNTTSVSRQSLTDTDDNSDDFTAGAPSPTNTAGETAGGGEDPEPTRSPSPSPPRSTRCRAPPGSPRWRTSGWR